MHKTTEQVMEKKIKLEVTAFEAKLILKALDEYFKLLKGAK